MAVHASAAGLTWPRRARAKRRSGGDACDVALIRRAPGTANWVHHYGYQRPGENEFEATDSANLFAPLQPRR